MTAEREPLFLLQIFRRHVVLGNFVSSDFAAISVGGILDAADDFGLVILPFFREF